MTVGGPPGVVVAVRAHVPSPRPQGFQALQQALGFADRGLPTAFVADPPAPGDGPRSVGEWLGRAHPPDLTLHLPRRDLGGSARGFQFRRTLRGLRSPTSVLWCRDARVAAAEVGHWRLVTHEWHIRPDTADPTHRKVLDQTDLHVAVAPGLADDILFAGVSADRILLLPNATSLLRPRAVDRAARRLDRPVRALLLGLHRRPGVRLALSAWSSDPTLPPLTVAGERQGADLRAWAGGPEVAGVTWTGPAWGANREDLLDEHDLWVCPYPEDEDTARRLCPLQVCDALASGLAVVTPSLPSIDAIDPESIAHRYDADSPESLAAAVHRAVTQRARGRPELRPRWEDRADRLIEAWRGIP